MSTMTETQTIRRALQAGEGVLRLAPNWVPRSFCIPGRRIKLDPRDYYSYGAHRGGIDERWFSSTTKADNGPLTTEFEGLSFVVFEDRSDTHTGGGATHKVLLTDAVSELGADLLGRELWDKYHKWPMYSKFFDNRDPLPHHLHQMEQHAHAVGMEPKPEAYFYPPQVNNHGGTFPHTFFGLEPGTTKEQVRHSLEIWSQGDNKITNLSKAMRLEPGTGWYVPAGLLHAPGSLCTYEPQWASDVFSMFQSLVAEVPIPWELVVKNVPDDKKSDLDYLVSMVDWEANTVPNIREVYFRPPLPVQDEQEMADAGYRESWITYGNEFFAAKELTVFPGRTVIIKDAGPYGFITMQGHGTINGNAIETPALIRFGQLTHDEYFVSAQAAQAGVTITNPSGSDPLVLLKHFGPNPESPK